MAMAKRSFSATRSMAICISSLQGFADREAIDRYAALMDDVADIIVRRYDGSLKAEHGTAAIWRRSWKWNGADGRPN